MLPKRFGNIDQFVLVTITNALVRQCVHQLNIYVFDILRAWLVQVVCRRVLVTVTKTQAGRVSVYYKLS